MFQVKLHTDIFSRVFIIACRYFDLVNSFYQIPMSLKISEFHNIPVDMYRTTKLAVMLIS